MFSRCVKNFSLIELLVVITIIIILAALLLPSLSKARDKAKTAICASNLKTIGTASQMYTGSYDDWIIPAAQGQWKTNTYEKLWWGILSGWGENGSGFGITCGKSSIRDLNQSVYRCPSETCDITGNAADKEYSQPQYMLNSGLAGFPSEGGTGASTLNFAHKLNCVKNPGIAIFAYDSLRRYAYNWLSDRAMYYVGFKHGVYDARQSGSDMPPSIGRANFIFMDSHVELLSFPDATHGLSEKNYARFGSNKLASGFDRDNGVMLPYE